MTRDPDNLWPKTLLPAEVSNARFLAFGYNAHVTSLSEIVSKERIETHATSLLQAVADDREKDKTGDAVGFSNRGVFELWSSHA